MTDTETKKVPAFRNKGFWIGVALFGLFMLLGMLNSSPPPAPEHVDEALRLRLIAQSQRLAAEDARKNALCMSWKTCEDTKKREKLLCVAWNACQDYSSARQACAVAGDFTNCVRVKVGDNLDISDCRNDGSLIEEPPDMPNRLQCMFYRLGG